MRSGVVRQLGRPNLLAATYSSNAAAAATAAMEELEETLLGSLQELQRIGSGVGERAACSHSAGCCLPWLRLRLRLPSRSLGTPSIVALMQLLPSSSP